MAEKRGETEKLVYDFDTAGLLEVYMPNLKGWYRVTSREFRSFNGKRRISRPIETKLGNVNIETVTEDYYGPVYLYGSNMITEYIESDSIEETDTYKKYNRISKNRGH